jgi:hypothetical protein
MKIRIGFVVGVAAMLVLAGSAGRAEPLTSQGSLLAVVWQQDNASLARLAPDSLETVSSAVVPLGRRISGIGRSAYTWALSPDGSQIAVGGRLLGGLRIVAVGPMGLARRSTLPLEPLGWLTPRRLLTGDQSNQNYAPDTLVTFDPVAGRVVARRALRGAIARNARVGERLVLLVSATRRIAPARIVAVDPQGRPRTVTLRRIPAGTAVTSTNPYNSRIAYPALAADPQGSRVFVLGDAPLVAEVDLASLRVRYHELSGRTALKLTSGFTRHVRWLGNGLLAVSGADYRTFTDAAGREQQVTTPSGVRLIDTRTWRVDMVDARASQFAVSRDSILVSGTQWSSVTQTRTGMGVSAYTLEGKLRFHVLDDALVPWVQVADGYAYVTLDQDLVHILDVHSGQFVATVRRPLPHLLVNEAVY